jgi:hypothetical protein
MSLVTSAATSVLGSLALFAPPASRILNQPLAFEINGMNSVLRSPVASPLAADGIQRRVADFDPHPDGPIAERLNIGWAARTGARASSVRKQIAINRVMGAMLAVERGRQW